MVARNLGWIVVLNGAPRSGKSSIATAMQEQLQGIWLNLGVDAYQQTLPPSLRPSIGLRPGGERPDIEAHLPVLFAALYESVAAHSRLVGEGLRTAAGAGRASGLTAAVGKPPKDERARVASRHGDLAGRASARRRRSQPRLANPWSGEVSRRSTGAAIEDRRGL